MPIHEFHCDACDKAFEELVRNSKDESALRCPACGGNQITRQFSVFAARSSEGRSAKSSPLPTGGCGRCGDMAGPCSMG
ncbi:MAG: zinc ribbon domain-containing protein [Phycisphaerales bacterium]|nr:zinc ribbon domain-containing protein [Phycisphaerales bacterium]MCB9857708.1 zinc ribbon domain-containing protein [Phycisphaerales bacterium]MCB9864797.1 zinc ribbon domain-containing protein [Phycisphaerales bacterium]